MVAGQHVDKIDLLAADDLRQPLAVLVGQHVQVVVRQFITENIGPVGSAQNTDPYRGRSHNFAVELLVLFQALGVILRGDKNAPLIHPRQREQHRAAEDIKNDSIDDQHTDPLQHLIYRDGIDDAQGGRREAFFQHQLAETRTVAKPHPLLHPLRFALDFTFRTGQRNQRLPVIVKDRHAHRQAARRKEAFHADGLLHAQHRLQAIGHIDRRQGVKIAHPGANALAYPEQVVAALVLRRVAILLYALMQDFQRLIALNRHVPQAKVGHAEVIAADEKDAVKVVGGSKIIPPVAHKPCQRLQRITPGGAHRAAVGIGVQGFKVGHRHIAVLPLRYRVPCRQAVTGDILQLFHYIRGTLDIALGLIGVEIKLLMDFGFPLVQRVDDIKRRDKRNKQPQQYRQRSEQIT